jgi:multimeric flavodoxin WrbA
MKVIAFLGSPRLEGNSEILLREALRGIREKGHEVILFRPSDMNIAPCLNCGGCDTTGECVIEDDMGKIYEAIRKGDRFIIASPIFFFGLPAQIKAPIDRCQAFYCEKYLLNRSVPSGPYGRKGLLVLVGGMQKEIGYKCGGATVTAFFRTISVPEHQIVQFPGVDASGEILKHPTALNEVYEAGLKLVAV